MFLDHFGLREQPFGVTPDPHFLYFSPSHLEAVASLLYGIQSQRGFMALIAKPGMGKTTLLFALLEHLRDSARTAFLFHADGDPHRFLRSLIADLGIPDQGDDIVRMQRRLNEVLIREMQGPLRQNSPIFVGGGDAELLSGQLPWSTTLWPEMTLEGIRIAAG